MKRRRRIRRGGRKGRGIRGRGRIRLKKRKSKKN
jgi:hypothetical protein